MTVAVEVARSDRLPARPRVGAHISLIDYLGPVHFPDRGLTARLGTQLGPCDDDSGESEAGEIVSSESVVSRRDATPIL
jgi:hypothetical protein